MHNSDLSVKRIVYKYRPTRLTLESALHDNLHSLESTIVG